ncbi:MAG: type IV secretion system protein VirD4 [Verrucomicrobiales bacterium]|jgi:type IV secretion system protein VirD4
MPNTYWLAVGVITVAGLIWVIIWLPRWCALLIHRLREFFLLDRKSSRLQKASKLLPDPELYRLLNAENTGLLIDGTPKRRLSEDASFQHCAIISPTGGGKTTKYVVPNMLTLDNCSMVVNDPSGAIYRLTSGYLQAKGFDIKVLNLKDPTRGMRYNPIAKAKTAIEVDQLAYVLMRSSNPVINAADQFWYDEPQNPIACLIHCLNNTGRPELQNLHNLLTLLQRFGDTGEPIADFVARYHGTDANLNRWLGFISSQDRMRAAVVTMARNTLRLLNIPEIASLMSADDFDFRQLRERKTVFYIISPERHAHFYRFILNTFFAQLFDAMMDDRYEREGLPLYCFFDEFGHSIVPAFDETCTTIRKFRVSLSIVLQSVCQLREKYGENAAKTILSGGMVNKIFYSGLDPDTSKAVEEMLGKRRVAMVMRDGEIRHQDENLMNADRISRIYQTQQFFLRNGEEPVLLPVTPFYKNPSLLHRTKIAPVPLPEHSDRADPVFVDIPITNQLGKLSERFEDAA